MTCFDALVMLVKSAVCKHSIDSCLRDQIGRCLGGSLDLQIGEDQIGGLVGADERIKHDPAATSANSTAAVPDRSRAKAALSID